MDRNCRAEPAAAARSAAGRMSWDAPRLVRLGTIESLTTKVDVTGRNDGGSGTMKRT